MIIEEVLRVAIGAWNYHPCRELTQRRDTKPAIHVTLSPAFAAGLIVATRRRVPLDSTPAASGLYFGHEATPPPHLQGHTLKTRQANEPTLARRPAVRQGGDSRAGKGAQAAKAVAAVQSELDHVQRNRIIVQELA